jgi:hypothetical protein
MRSHRTLVIGSLLVFSFEFFGANPLAATPGFSISATNTTMPSSGFGSIPVTLTSIDGYAGSVTTNCNPLNPPAGARLPICGAPTAPPIYKLTANQSLAGSITLMPYGDDLPLPASMLRCDGPALALAGVLLFGVRIRSRKWRRFAPTFFVLCVLGGLAGISGCGGSGNSNGMTPGTYQYTARAADINTGAYVTTNVAITVP